MSVTLADILNHLNDKTRNSTTGALDNNKRTRGINRTLQDMQDSGDWNATRRTKTFYFIPGVYEYSLQNYVGATCQDNDGSTSILDFKNPHDLRPIDPAGKSLDYHEQAAVRSNIRRSRLINEYSIDNGLLLVGYAGGLSSIVHECDSLTANGTVAASGDASNLTIDEVTYSEGTGALNFDTTAGTSLIITFTDFTALDLEELQNRSQLTLDLWLPTITNFSSVRVRLGSSSGAYWEKTETVPAGQAALATGKNTFAFRWASSSQTGTPDFSAVDYLQIVITYGSATTATDFRIDNIRIGAEVEMELDYYSLAMVKDAAGDYQLEFNSDSVTQTDTLLGGTDMFRTVLAGAELDMFEIIGGKSERDRTDAANTYARKKAELLRKSGRPIRRPIRMLNFPKR